MNHVFFAPHNDDETLFGTFTLLRFRPLVVVCLRSVRMGLPDYHDGMPVTAETREAETAAAMGVLGCEWEQWQVPDDRPDWDAVRACMSEIAVDRVFAPAVEAHGHEQHNRVGELALEVFGADRVTRYLTYTRERGRSTDGVTVGWEFGWPDLKARALACYPSQAAHPMTAAHFAGVYDEFYAT